MNEAQTPLLIQKHQTLNKNALGDNHGKKNTLVSPTK
jgi:hypothetical protein